MIKIAPSILSGDFANMGKSVEDATAWGADYIHFDVMDGVFVPNITFGMPMCKAIRKHTTLPIDAHLMITLPEKYVQAFCDAGADIVTFHPDASQDVAGALNVIKKNGKACGLVLNPDKGLELVAPYMDRIDMLVLMGVYAGFGGQKFIPEVLGKISEAHRMIVESRRDIRLELDGGVTEENAKSMTDRGVDVVVGGSSVFRSADPAKTIRILRGE
ncbi:MAG: ribulose-phosphate 3-epimerase [Clostridia bacterium]|nr:ribulose-phosphate 3-epimerase [Clostridia bacterium]